MPDLSQALEISAIALPSWNSESESSWKEIHGGISTRSLGARSPPMGSSYRPGYSGPPLSLGKHLLKSS